MKNSEICRAAMPLIRTPDGVRSARVSYLGMCCALVSLQANSTVILKKVFKNKNEWIKRGSYFYPVVHLADWGLEEGYTSRIIFLELAALLWEEEGN